MRTIRRRKADKVLTKSRREARTIKLMGYLDAVSGDTKDTNDHPFYQRKGVQL